MIILETVIYVVTLALDSMTKVQENSVRALDWESEDQEPSVLLTSAQSFS